MKYNNQSISIYVTWQVLNDILIKIAKKRWNLSYCISKKQANISSCISDEGLSIVSSNLLDFLERWGFEVNI